MNIPDSITIRGITYQVKFSKDLVEDGYLDIPNSIIRIRKGMSQEYTEHVFFHEVGHIIETFSGLDLSDAVVDSLGAMVREVVDQMKEHD